VCSPATGAGPTLTVANSGPRIVVQPASQGVLLGENAALSVATSGSLPLHYQWQLGESNIAGATQATLVVTNFAATNAGTYRVAVTNAFGGIVSSNATLVEASSLVVGWGLNNYGQTNVPADLIDAVAVASGYYHSLALRGNGTVVAWGDNGGGQTTIPAGLPHPAAIAAGDMHTVVLLSDGSPFITRQPVNLDAYSGTTPFLSLGAAGAGPLSYQWQMYGTNLPGATNAILSLAAAQPTNSGPYSVAVTNSIGSVTSAVATP